MSAKVVALAIAVCGGVPLAGATEVTSRFADALVSEGRSPEITAEEDIYAPLLGTWDVEARDRKDDGTFQVTRGEWLFSRTLEGRAFQDVWIAPTRDNRQPGPPQLGNRYGTSVRTFDLNTRRWQVTWFNPVSGAFDVLLTRVEGKRIIQEGTRRDGQRMRWIFQEITANTFHWTGEGQLADGSWHLEAEFFGRRHL